MVLRHWSKALGLFVVVCATSAAPVLAVPPCSYIGYTDCNATCQLLGQGACVSWSVGTCQSSSAQYTYTCQTGPNFTGWCSGCTNSGGGCFLAGTPITMADGSTKPIEEVQAGDLVLAFDEVTGEMKPDKVRSVEKPVTVPFHLVINGSMRLTPDHRVRANGKWVEIGKLAVGDTLTAPDGKAVPIKSIERVDGKVAVYNFAVNPYETYVANGVIVHNRKPNIEELPPSGP